MIMSRLPQRVQVQLAAGGKRSMLLIVIQNAVWRYLSRLPHVIHYNHASVARQWESSHMMRADSSMISFTNSSGRSRPMICLRSFLEM